jgi:hypothetical protein
MNIQRFMVAVIFLAIFFWSGSALVPEAVRRWRRCDARAAEYLAEARSLSLHAARFTALSRHYEAAWLRERAENYTKDSWKYRRALVIPWEFWSLGEY